MKRLLFFSVLLLAQLLTKAQDNGIMRIEKTNGSVVEYNVNEIKHVSFIAPEIFSVSPESLTFESGKGSTQTLHITSNVNWKIMNLPEWLSASSTEGKNNADVVLATNSMNSAQKERISFFYIVCDNDVKVINVKQERYIEEQISAISDSYVLSSDAAIINIDISSNTKWTVSSDASWLKPLSTIGNGNGSVKVNVDANNTTYDRTGNMSFTTSTGQVATVKVVQKAALSGVLFEEPCINWGCSISEVKRYMNSYELMSESDEDGLVIILYYHKNKESYTSYILDEQSGLEFSMVAFDKKVIKESEVHNFLISKYEYIGVNNGSYEYRTKDAQTVVIMEESSDGKELLVYYYQQDIDVETKFEEPYVVWKSSLSNVKSAMQSRGYTLVGSSQVTNDINLVYAGKYDEYYSKYFFDAYSKLESVSIVFKKNSFGINEVCNEMSNTFGYNYLGVTDGRQHMYVSSDSKTAAFVYESQFTDTKEEIVIAMFIDIDVVLTNAKSTGSNKVNSTNLKHQEFSDISITRRSQMVEKIKTIINNAKQ